MALLYGLYPHLLISMFESDVGRWVNAVTVTMEK